MNDAIDHASVDLYDNDFNLTIEEVRILAKYRQLSPHQQKGIVQAIDLIRPSATEQRPRSGSIHPAPVRR